MADSHQVSKPAQLPVAFATTRGEDGILVGVRNPLAPQFGVGSDASGLSIGANLLLVRNLCSNPRAHDGLATWDWNKTLTTLTRQSTARFDLPDGADACFRLDSSDHLMATQTCTPLIPIPPDWKRLYALCEACVSEAAWQSYYWSGPFIGFGFYSSEGYRIGGWYTAQESSARYDDTDWARAVSYADLDYPRSVGAVYFDIYLIFASLPTGYGWWTKLMVTDQPRTYADGDSAGWVWDGTPHASTSRGMS